MSGERIRLDQGLQSLGSAFNRFLRVFGDDGDLEARLKSVAAPILAEAMATGKPGLRHMPAVKEWNRYRGTAYLATQVLDILDELRRKGLLLSKGLATPGMLEDMEGEAAAISNVPAVFIHQLEAFATSISRSSPEDGEAFRRAAQELAPAEDELNVFWMALFQWTVADDGKGGAGDVAH